MGESIVTGNSISAFLIIILVVVAFGGTFFVRAFFTRRAIFKVVKIFYQHHALGIHDAKTLRELGLERPDFVRRMMKPRDYKQYALEILIKRGIINVNADGRLYMVEERLDQELRCKSNDLLPHGRS
jgi:hypothetical protein